MGSGTLSAHIQRNQTGALTSHRRTHTWDRQTQTHTHTASFGPQHISLHYCQQCASVLPALLLMPYAWCTAILAACPPACLPACLSISLHPNPQPLNHGNPQLPFSKRPKTQKHNTSVREPVVVGGEFLVLLLQSTEQQPRRSGEQKIQSGVNERKENQCRFTAPSPPHPPLPPPMRLSSVQLWLCDAKLIGATLSSIHIGL